MLAKNGKVSNGRNGTLPIFKLSDQSSTQCSKHKKIICTTAVSNIPKKCTELRLINTNCK